MLFNPWTWVSRLCSVKEAQQAACLFPALGDCRFTIRSRGCTSPLEAGLYRVA